MAAKVVPAQLSFLAIYNTTLGRTEETFREQLVFYYSKQSKSRRRRDDGEHDDEHGEENEQLRQIGLAQGMVSFARSFSEGEPIDHVDTEKSRIVIHELEKGWWILASIDLTRLPAPPTPSKSPNPDLKASSPSIEYSAREVSPPDLLTQQLLRAHNVFRLHHGPSLDDLYVRLKRVKFCNILENFWTRFAKTWDVLLHGNPATDIYGGIKLAAGGELGMGVGEEEWGSGERDVFEHFTAGTDGLVDMVVSRFGEPSTDSKETSNKSRTGTPFLDSELWLGNGRDAEPGDGVIFSGIGAISRSSLRDISNWMQLIYTQGDRAYGVKDNPNSDRRKRRRRNNPSRPTNNFDSPRNGVGRSNNHARAASEGAAPRRTPRRTASGLPPGIPPPIVTAVETSLEQASRAAGTPEEEAQSGNDKTQNSGYGETLMNYLTFGYGSGWSSGFGAKKPKNPSVPSQDSTQEQHQEDDHEKSNQAAMQYLEPQPDTHPLEEAINTQIRRENHGHFLVGLQGDLDTDELSEDEIATHDTDTSGGGDSNQRLMLRTLHVKVNNSSSQAVKDMSSDETIAAIIRQPTHDKLRVLVYVHRPFIWTLLFTNRTETLSYPGFYRKLHAFMAPLHKPLTLSTSPARVAARIAAHSQPYTTASSPAGPNTQPIYDLVFDPLHLTVHSSIPSIPEPGTAGAEGLAFASASAGTGAAWTRIEALNVHSQILATLSSARRAPNDIERTVKTGRGWWLVWMRLPPSEPVEASTKGDTQHASGTVSHTSLRSLQSAENLGGTAAESGSGSSTPRDSSDNTTSPQRTATLPTASLREALLIRRARDAPTSSHRANKSSGGSGSGAALWRLGLGGAGASSMGGAAAGWGPRGLAEGVGVDARRYIEGLLSLSR